MRGVVLLGVGAAARALTEDDGGISDAQRDRLVQACLNRRRRTLMHHVGRRPGRLRGKTPGAASPTVAELLDIEMSCTVEPGEPTT